jgi:hypothetical protein
MIEVYWDSILEKILIFEKRENILAYCYSASSNKYRITDMSDSQYNYFIKLGFTKLSQRKLK